MAQAPGDTTDAGALKDAMQALVGYQVGGCCGGGAGGRHG
jgi:hypothetical protein